MSHISKQRKKLPCYYNFIVKVKPKTREYISDFGKDIVIDYCNDERALQTN